jgi:hypothetical protein
MNTLNGLCKVSITGGFVGFFSDTPYKLNQMIEKINKDGYKVVQIVPEKTDLLSILIMLLLLVVTFGIYTQAPGYYIVYEREIVS